MHNHSIFEFVGQFSSELFELVCRIENGLLDQPLASLIQARLYSEQLVKIISKEEGIEDIYPLKHSERIHKLYRQNAVEEDIYLKLEWIRKKGNKAAHDIKEVNITDVLQVHKFLFEISVWYMQVYVSYDFEAPIYKLPINKAQETNPLGAEDLEVLMKPYVDQTMQKMDEMWAEVQRELEALRQEKKQLKESISDSIRLQQSEIAATAEKDSLASSQVNLQMTSLEWIFVKNNFRLTKKTKKATEFEHIKNREVLYLMANKNINIVLNPKTVENNQSFIGGKESHSTALTRFPKKIKNGKTPTSYGYAFKLKTEEELGAFLKSLNDI
ncbi:MULTISPECIES: DUF4145 domain-containing protein [Peribacillus]|uniref:DUF4145 domain-containing protein n=1 Tax=Peribacillus TaxID=2675229 RepID=UPI001F4E4997|nr:MULTISPECIES: DUF4145 domain-containing protein [unclassified Peribacillus]MCK1981374.1 DUF4145 domain-containing protein [Peribacillus sp. Aquil_B1]MCK2006879.1 DUF4145 domain-containing protein [Peribacillus sp. Aquil_B8]